jgi:hypothetical protein
MSRFPTVRRQARTTWISRFVLTAALGFAVGTTPSRSRLHAQPMPRISAQALAQIDALVAEKARRTSVQRKVSSNLLYAGKMARGEAIAQGVARLEVEIPGVEDRRAVVDVRAQVSQPVLDQLVALGAELLDVNATYDNIRLRVDLGQIEAIAALPEVVFVQPKQEAITSQVPPRGDPLLTDAPRTRALTERKRNDRGGLMTTVQNPLGQVGPILNVGSRNSEGDAKHRANVARTTYGASGAGVKIGVLSDGVNNLATSQALGDLGPVTVLPGQEGSGDEGTAMLEIIHDLAPDAQLFFASGGGSMASFAQNIRNLRTAGCDIIVDDLRYLVETPFQDGQTTTSSTNGGIVIQAVKDVTAAGALYFSSAGNYGNKNAGTSSTWEGDFVDGGSIGEAGNIHLFGGQDHDVLASSSRPCSSGPCPIVLFWSDPLGSSSNDYDLYRLNSSATAILAASTDVQNGTQDPIEGLPGGSAGELIVVVKFSGSGRYLHLFSTGARLSISTGGEISGHAATSAPNSFGVAATSALVNGQNPFNSSHVAEPYSSDGPRRIFFQGNGTAITPGNLTSSGGQVLLKPDVTAADCVSVTGVGGFPSVFCGTSAAAPHAGAIAGLVRSRNVRVASAAVRAAMLADAIDIEAPGWDRDSGYGIVMADSVGRIPVAKISAPGDFDGDGKSEVTVYRPSNGTWFVLRSKSSFADFSPYRWGVSSDVAVPGDYDGDGQADVAVYRPSNGTWYILTSISNYTEFFSVNWGNSTDAPVPADYDGDGKTDIAVYRPSSGTWFILYSSTNYTTYTAISWGVSTDKPVPGDYDGDGKADIAVYRPATQGTWYVLTSRNDYTTYFSMDWGISSDVPVPGDYDGDGKADLAVYRPAMQATWYVLTSSTNYTGFFSVNWGVSTDVPVPGDYDGDSKTDIVVVRPSNWVWYILESSTNLMTYRAISWGTSGDVPVLSRQ